MQLNSIYLSVRAEQWLRNLFLQPEGDQHLESYIQIRLFAMCAEGRREGGKRFWLCFIDPSVRPCIPRSLPSPLSSLLPFKKGKRQVRSQCKPFPRTTTADRPAFSLQIHYGEMEEFQGENSISNEGCDVDVRRTYVILMHKSERATMPSNGRRVYVSHAGVLGYAAQFCHSVRIRIYTARPQLASIFRLRCCCCGAGGDRCLSLSQGC